MKVVFLKDHVSHKAGDVAQLEDGLGNYLVRCGVVKANDEEGGEVKEKVEIPQVKEKAETPVINAKRTKK